MMERNRAHSAAPAVDLARNLPLGDLLALGTQLRADITPDLLLQDVADAITHVLGFPRAYVRLRNPDTDAFEARAFAGLDPADIERLRAEAVPPARYQTLLQTGERISESYLVPDDGGAPQTVRRSRRHAPARLLLVPLRSHGDRLLGAIYIDPSGQLDESSVRILEAIARQAALSLENAQLAARMQRLLAKEQLLAELGRDVSATLDLSTILSYTGERLRRAFPTSALLLLGSDGTPTLATAAGNAGNPSTHLLIGRWVAEHGMPFHSNDLASDSRLLAMIPDDPPGHMVGSKIAVPLRSGGRVIGAITAASEQPNAFTFEDVDLLEAVAAQIGGPIGGAQLYQQTERLAEQVRRRNEHLLVLNSLAGLAVSTLDIDRLMSTVTAQIHQGFGFGHVELYRIDEASGLAVLAARASRFVQSEAGDRRALDVGAIGQAYTTGRTARIATPRTEENGVGRSELCVPVVASGRVLALLNLESSREDAFTDEDVEAIETAADVLAGAMENARLYRRAQEAAVLEERSRLARDLHDSISQQLFSMTLTAQAARAHLEKNPARAGVQLERLQETAAAALAEMRALIFQLRPPALSEHGLIAALQQHVASLDRREDMDVIMTVEGDEQEARGIEQAIYRIAQEALNNVLKHAGACHVTVKLELFPDRVGLKISDNGRGFNMAVPPSGRHLGMISMRERATELGGTLHVQSEPGHGTDIVVVVPREASPGYQESPSQ
jgi:signal transduction histidine kinase